MNRKTLIIILFAIAVAAAAAIVVWQIYYTEEPTQQGDIITNDHPTHGAVYFVSGEPQADSAMLGKWQSIDNPQWYKVYYDDYDEDEHLFWGKEWDESDDVFEEDLNYHGNGWFRWEKRGNSLCEYATMDTRDVPIAKLYTVLFSSMDSLAYCERERKKSCFHFSRVK